MKEVTLRLVSGEQGGDVRAKIDGEAYELILCRFSREGIILLYKGIPEWSGFQTDDKDCIKVEQYA